MPEILHESEGLKIVKNDKNQFVVCTLFFHADPSKRSAAWRREAEAGMTPAKFAREYLIDYGAQFGERVFPQISSHPEKIIIHQPYPVFPSDQVFYGGFDYGMRNPSSFHVYAVWDGVTHCVWELYEPCKNIKEFSAKMLECPYYEKIRWIAADPHIADLRHYGRDGTGASIMDQFRDYKIRKFVLASNDEEAWMGIMRRHWDNDVEDPTFVIWDCCPNMIEEFKSAVFAQSKQAVMSANPKEAIADVNNHAMDDCKYFMLTAPKNHQQSTVKFPIMVNKWSK